MADDARAVRRGMIDAALTWLHGTDPEVVNALVDPAELWPKLTDDITAMADRLQLSLNDLVDPDEERGAWRAAQRILLAAGLPCMPEDFQDRPPTP